jgi:DNA-binding GntR family transcriptional regulator
MVLETPIQKQSLQKMVYDTLRHAILQREIAPGDQINIRKLAESLSVSTMPVREALRQLETEGLVLFHSNKRIVVNRLSRDDLREIYALRVPLEETALSRCLDRPDEKDMTALEALHEEMSRPEVMGAQWFDLNRAFHMRLHEMAGSPRLFQILQGLWNSTGPYLRIFSEDVTAVSRANREHGELLEAMRKGDRRRSKNILRAHLLNGLKAVEAHLGDED